MPVSTTGRPAAVLSILVTANTRTAQANLAALDRQMAYSVKRSSAGVVALQRALVATRYAAVGGIAAVTGAVAAAAKYESAFASVEKTVEASDKQIAHLRKGILDLSTHLPQSAAELAEVAGEAGAMGVKAKDLLTFTKVASQLGDTTKLSADAAAQALARLGNLMDNEGRRAFKRMGSTLVDLGNKGTSTEDEIAAMSLRIAAAGRQVGLTTADVLGLSASLANIGIHAEMGGSAITRVMLSMQASVAQGGEELKVWAETSGMSVAEFKKSFERDVPGTIATFAEGLNKIKQDGGAVALTLQDMGKAAGTSMNDIRVRQTLLGIAANTDKYREALGTANKAWKENNALSEEAHKRYGTLNSSLEILRNNVVRAGIDFGTKLIPDIKETVELLRDPDLTIDEKVEGVVDKIGDIFSKAIPMMAEVGGRMGLTLIKGLGDTILHADVLGKLFAGGALIRMIGGRGALMAVGASAGRFIGLGVGSGAAAGAAAGISGAASTAGAAGLSTAGLNMVAGGSGGIFSRVKGALGKIRWARLGGLGIGLAIADGIMEDVEVGIARGSSDLITNLQGIGQETTKDTVMEFLQTAVPGGKTGLEGPERRAEATDLLADLQEIMDTDMRVPMARIGRLRDRISSLDGVTEGAKDQLLELLDPKVKENMIFKRGHQVEMSIEKAFTLKDLVRTQDRNMDEIVSNFGEGTKASKGLISDMRLDITQQVWQMVRENKISTDKGKRWLRELGLSAKDMPADFRVMSGGARSAFHKVTDFTRQMARTAGGHMDAFTNDAIGAFHTVNKEGPKKTKDTKDKVVGTVNSMVGAVSEGYKRLETDTNKALKGVGAKSVNFGITAADTSSKEVAALHKQRGGLIGGSGSGDSQMVMAEPGEGFINRSAVKALGGKKGIDAINSMIPRFRGGGMVTGDTAGLVPGFMSALGQMASGSGHSISVNSGLRTRAEQASLYAAYQAGTGNLAAAPGSSHHESGIAADISPGRETFGGVAGKYGLGFTVPSESWHIELLNAAAAGKMGVKAQKLARVLLRGPEGAWRNVGQGGLDKVRSAAQKFVNKKSAAQSVMPTGAAGQVGGGMSMGQIEALAQAVGMPNPHLMAAIAMAESGGQVGVINSIGATGLWQVLQSAHPQYSVKQLTSARGNAMAAKQILASEGLRAWEAYTNGMYQSYMQRGGIVPSLDQGGRVSKRGLAEVHPGDVHRGKSTIELHLHGSAKAALATLDDVYAIVDGERVEIDSHQRNRGRHARPRRARA